MNKLYLIDGMSLVFRAYHAMAKSELKSPAGEPTGAVFGFINTISSFMEKEQPNFMAIVFDTSEPTFRHIKYDQYKANRADFPEELIPQLPRIKQFIKNAGIPQIEMHGYEADDIIATLAKQATQEQVETYCITNDKDYYQLVNEHIFILKPSRKGEEMEIVDKSGVFDKFGVRPDQVIEVQALIGDSVDNVPGVKGVGEKTAIPLIVEYENLEGLYENIDNVKSKSVKEKLIKDKEMAFLSRELVTLHTDVPMDFALEHCKIDNPNFANMDDLLKELGFRTLRQKWNAKSGNTTPSDIIEIVGFEEEKSYATLENVEKNYILVNNKELLEQAINVIKSSTRLSFDLETDALDRNSCSIIGISLAVTPHSAYYIAVYDDIMNKKEEHNSQNDLFASATNNDVKKINSSNSLPLSYVLKELKDIFTSASISKLGQNTKFDEYILKRYGVEVKPITFDTMLASYILNPDDKHNMDDLSRKWLHYSPISIKSLIGEKKSTQISMADLTPEEVYRYACEDSDITLMLANALEAELQKDEKLNKLAKEIEIPCSAVLTEMEYEGISIDTNALKELEIKISQRIIELKELIFKEAGEEFNIDSPKQLGFILFERMQLPSDKKTKTGYSTDVEVLNTLAEFYPIAKYLLEYRTLAKLKSTYVQSLPKMLNPNTNRLHTTYNQTVASTGRLSSVDPNLQNIPIRTDLGKEIRRAFVAKSEDYLLLSADYSQVELRIMAHICGDQHLIDAFKNGHDIHAATSAILYNIPIEEVNSDMRRIAKTVNFGIMYGLGAFGLSQRLGMGRKEASNIIENYFEKYPGIKTYIEMTVNSTREKGYAETLSGRRRYFPDINSKNRTIKNAAERAAINMPIQGTASDMMKIAMINIANELKRQNMTSKMLLQVHDELIFEVEKSELEELRPIVVNLMESALSLGEVPVVVDSGIGHNWFEAH